MGGLNSAADPLRTRWTRCGSAADSTKVHHINFLVDFGGPAADFSKLRRGVVGPLRVRSGSAAHWWTVHRKSPPKKSTREKSPPRIGVHRGVFVHWWTPQVDSTSGLWSTCGVHRWSPPAESTGGQKLHQRSPLADSTGRVRLHF